MNSFRFGMSCLLVLGLSACGASEPAPSFIVLNPPQPSPTRDQSTGLQQPAHNLPAAKAVVRDTQALQKAVGRYAYRRDTTPAEIDQLRVLLLRVQDAVKRMRQAKKGDIYQASDIAAARSAADTLAHFLQSQAPNRPEPPVEELAK